MAHRTLEINVISAKGLKNVNLIDKMDVYCIISLKGGSAKQKTRTPVDKDCGKNPNWNFPVKFTIDESLAKKNGLNVKFKVMCERILGDKELGKVNVPVKELLDSPGEGGSMKFVSFQVRKPSGRSEGSLDFSYRLGDTVAAPFKPEKNKGGGDYHQPVTAIRRNIWRRLSTRRKTRMEVIIISLLPLIRRVIWRLGRVLVFRMVLPEVIRLRHKLGTDILLRVMVDIHRRECLRQGMDIHRRRSQGMGILHPVDMGIRRCNSRRKRIVSLDWDWELGCSEGRSVGC